jgi:hypothetical protein
MIYIGHLLLSFAFKVVGRTLEIPAEVLLTSFRSRSDPLVLEVIVSATSVDMTYKGIGVVSSLP